MYALLLSALPRAGVAAAMTRAIAAYLAVIPEPSYAVFGTGNVGYTVAQTRGKAVSAEK